MPSLYSCSTAAVYGGYPANLEAKSLSREISQEHKEIHIEIANYPKIPINGPKGTTNVMIK